jgi:hypothetical protein
MMEKLLSLILSASLLLGAALPAVADGVTPADLRAETEAGWHRTYEAYGRTVTVDIPVQVPDVDALASITATLLPVSAYAPDTTGSYEGIDDGDHFYYNAPGAFRVDTPNQTTLRSFSKADEDTASAPRGMEMQSLVVYFNDLDWDTAYTFNQPTTVRDADALLSRTAAEYFPEYPPAFTPHRVDANAGMRQYDAATRTFSGEPWENSNAPLIVYFDQVLNGVPVLGYVNPDDVGRGYSSYLGGIVIFQDKGMDSLYTSTEIYGLGQDTVVDEDVSLCDFSQILAYLEQLISQGRLRKVTSLRPGYAAVYDQDGESTLRPAWALEGELFDSAHADYQIPVTEAMTEPLEYVTIFVDAQTGERMD